MNQKDLKNLDASFTALSWCYVQGALRVPAARHVYQEQDFAAVFIETKHSDVVSLRHALFGLYDGWKANAKVKEVFDGIFNFLMENAGWSSLRYDEQKCCWADSLSIPCLQPHDDVGVEGAACRLQDVGFKPSTDALSALICAVHDKLVDIKPAGFHEGSVPSQLLEVGRRGFKAVLPFAFWQVAHHRLTEGRPMVELLDNASEQENHLCVALHNAVHMLCAINSYNPLSRFSQEKGKSYGGWGGGVCDNIFPYVEGANPKEVWYLSLIRPSDGHLLGKDHAPHVADMLSRLLTTCGKAVLDRDRNRSLSRLCGVVTKQALTSGLEEDSTIKRYEAVLTRYIQMAVAFSHGKHTADTKLCAIRSLNTLMMCTAFYCQAHRMEGGSEKVYDCDHFQAAYDIITKSMFDVCCPAQRGAVAKSDMLPGAVFFAALDSVGSGLFGGLFGPRCELLFARDAVFDSVPLSPSRAGVIENADGAVAVVEHGANEATADAMQPNF